MYKVMIVDDEYPARNMLDLLINWEENGFQMAAKAENGKQALELYEKLHPDLLITDIQMPVMDGIQLIREIRKENERQCVLVLSCHESFDYAQQAIRLGVRDYLIKDMLTTEQLRKCLLRTKEFLDLQNSTGILPTENFRLRREPDQAIQQIYPVYFSKAERRMDKLSSCLFKGDYATAAELVRLLFQTPFEGLVRYHFLSWITQSIHHQLLELCEKKNISPEEILGEYALTSEELLLSNDPEEASQVLCDWLDRLALLPVPQEEYSFRIKNVLSYLQENYFQDISLQSVAEQFGVHKVYLARTFKAETGETLNEYLNKIRVEKAKLLLSITNDTAQDISYTVGFNSSQSFYNVFKKYTGSSPTEYRGKIRS